MLKKVTRFTFCTIVILLSLHVKAQTILINPSGDGGFESGSDLETNGWTVANGSANNKWFAGNPGTFSSNKAYISDDPSGFTYNYDNTGNSLVHFYRDITFPAGLTKITLSFKWMGLGEVTAFDGLQVSVAPITVTPTASTNTGGTQVTSALVTGATVVGNIFYFNKGTEQTETITIPSSVSGNCISSTTMRLIFSWRNDNTAGTQPPTSIDEISLTAAPFSLLSNGGIFTINNQTGTGGTNYKNFTDAINELNTVSNCGGFSAPVIFNVSAGQSFVEDIPVITASGTASNTITFQKVGTGTNPVIRPTGTNAVFTPDGGIVLSGADYFTFDGINITINSGNAVEAGYNLRAASGSNGAQYNTIKNATIVLNRTNTSSAGISQTTNFNITSLNGTNSYNKYYNISVQNANTGIFLNQISATFPDESCEIGSIAGGTTIIGAGTNDDIGNVNIAAFGIRTTNQKNITISNVEVRNVTTTGGSNTAGISLEGSQGISNVFKNKVHNISSSALTGNVVIYGIKADAATGAVINVYNNFVYNLTNANSPATPATLIRGIGCNIANTSGTVNFVYNNVRVDATNTAVSSTTFYQVNGTGLLRNNIFANFSASAINTCRRYTVYVAGGNLSSNYNDLYIPTNTNNFIGYAGGIDRTSLADWQASTGSPDANSKNVDPYFSGSNDLHIGNAQLNAVGVPYAGITDDIDGENRDASTPDIGADEITLTQKALESIVYNQATQNRVAKATDNNPILRIDIKTTGNSGALNLNNFQVTSLNTSNADVSSNGVKLYRTNAPVFSTANLISVTSFSGSIAAFSGLGYDLPGNSTTYFWVTYDVPSSATANNTLDAKIPSGGIDIDGDQYPSTEQSPAGNRLISGPLSGIYYVGASQLSPNYTDLTSVTADLITFGIGGPVTFALKSDYSSASETSFPLTINEVTGASSTNTITIKPDASVNASISGSGTAIFKLNGADFVTIDGSNAGSSSQNLTITNNSSSTNTTVVWIANTSAGATFNTVKNCFIIGGVNNTAGIAGISISGSANTTTAGSDNDNITIQNNNIQRAYTGIYAAGTTGFAYDNLIISNNIIGNATDANSIGNLGINMGYVSGALINGNTIMNAKTGNNPCGISMSTGVVNTTISANKISDMFYSGTGGYGGKGIYLVQGTNASLLTIANNVIYNIRGDGWTQIASSDPIVGIHLFGSAAGVKLYNNAVYLGNGSIAGATNTSGTVSAGIYFGAGSSNIDFRNNLVATNIVNTNSLASKTYAVYSSASVSAFSSIDYNTYFISGLQGILANIAGTDRTTLSAIQAGFGGNTNSLITDPGFTSSTSLIPKSGYYSSGIALAGITTDITGAARYAIPDMGAYEGPSAGRWIGTVSTNWSSNANWKDNTIPTASTDVSISVNSLNLPSLTEDATTNKLVLPVAASVLNLNGQILTLNGAISGTGTLSGSNSSGLIIAGSVGSLKFTTGANTLKSLTLNTGATAFLGTALNITAGATPGLVTVASGATLGSSGNLTLKSDASGTAMITTSAGNITGNVTIERYIPSLNRKKYTLVTAPVNSPSIYNAWQEGGATTAGYGTQITGPTGTSAANGFDATSSSTLSSIFTYNDDNATGSKWVGLTNTNATTLGTGKGYLLFVRGDRSEPRYTTFNSSNTTLRATGTVTIGNFTTTGLVTGANKFNLVANPYASPIDWLSTSLTKTQIISSFTAYDPNLQVFVTSNGTTVSPSVGSQQQERYIQSGQAFFIQNDATGNAPALVFTEAAKATPATGSANTVFGNEIPKAQLNVNLYSAADKVFTDGVVVLFDKDFKIGVDKEDAGKMDNLNETFALRRNGLKLSIEGRPLITSNDTLFFSMAAFVKKEYKMVIDGNNILNANATLEDRFTGTKQPIDLQGLTIYKFNVTDDAASKSNERFIITFGSTIKQNNLSDIAAATSLFVKVGPNPVSDKLTVSFKTNAVQNTVITIVNSLGQVVKKVSAGKVDTGNITVDVKKLAAGTYTVELLNGENKIATKRIIKD